MQFLTINQTAKAIGLPHTCLRAMQAQGKLPGFYAGSRWYVNVDMLREQLEKDSRPAAEKNEEARAQ